MKFILNVLLYIIAIYPVFAQNLGIDRPLPLQKLDINGKLRIGNDAARAQAGTLRYNQSNSLFEGYNGSNWHSLSGNTLPAGDFSQTLYYNGNNWTPNYLLRNNGTAVEIGNLIPNSSALLIVGADINGAIDASSTSTNTATIGAFNNSYYAMKAESLSGGGLFAKSGSYYSGVFHGRQLVYQGGNGSAGVEFAQAGSLRDAFIGLTGVNNEFGIWGYAYNSWVTRWNMSTATACFAVQPTVCSDSRLKRNFTKLTGSLSGICKLQGYNYFMKNEKITNTQTGFIAQEIQHTFPELVVTDSDGFLSVNYVGLVPHLVEAVKTLRIENQELKARLDKVEAFLKINNNLASITNQINPK
jgi:hypothetical protein